MKVLFLTLCIFLCACVPGAKPPSERSNAETPIFPTSAPDVETDPADVIPTLPSSSLNGIGVTPSTITESASVININPGTFNYNLIGAVLIERVPLDEDGKMDFENPIFEQLESAKIELVDYQSNQVIAESFITSGSFSFNVNRHAIVYIRISAESQNPKVSIKDNTNYNQLYQFETDFFDLVNNQSLNIVVNVGWTGSIFLANSSEPDVISGSSPFLGGYLHDSFSAPFAILNHAHQILNATKDSSPVGMHSRLDALEYNIYWSPDNEPSIGKYKLGQIAKAHYNPIEKAIFLSGKQNVDQDEWDIYLQTELLGLYLLDQASRNESYVIDIDRSKVIQPSQLFPMTFSHVFAALMNNEKDIYTQAGGVHGQQILRTEDLKNTFLSNREWYYFEGQRKYLWDLFDSRNEGIDNDSLTKSDLFATLFNSEFTQSYVPANILSFGYHLKERNFLKNTYLQNMASFHAISPLWEDEGPTATDTSLPSEFDEINPFFIRSGVDISNDHTLKVNRNDGRCYEAGSEAYLSFTPISNYTKIEIDKNDLVIVEIWHNGELIWYSANNDDEVFNLETTDAAQFVSFHTADPRYLIKLRSHPLASNVQATVNFKLTTETTLAPLPNIANQHTLYLIPSTGTKTLSITPYQDRCHRFAQVFRYRFLPAPDRNVKMTVNFDTSDEIEYDILIDNEIIESRKTTNNFTDSFVLEFNEEVPTMKYMTIRVQSKRNLFEGQQLKFKLESITN